MENNNDIIELLDILYGMVNEAWGVPLGNDKCIIEREKAIDIINDIKANLPTSIAESKRLVSARDEFIGNAKREAEALRKNAEEESERLVNEQEVLKIAKQRAVDILELAEKRSAELKRVAGEYVDKIMRDSEKQLAEALETVRSTQAKFRTSSEYEVSSSVSTSAVNDTNEAQSKESDTKETAKKTDEAEPKQSPAAGLRKGFERPRNKPTIIDIDDEDNWVEK